MIQTLSRILKIGEIQKKKGSEGWERKKEQNNEE